MTVFSIIGAHALAILGGIAVGVYSAMNLGPEDIGESWAVVVVGGILVIVVCGWITLVPALILFWRHAKARRETEPRLALGATAVPVVLLAIPTLGEWRVLFSYGGIVGSLTLVIYLIRFLLKT
ncbi:MAG: hypothetical protein ACO3FC_08040 [Ilumatobacteraceae bacterium]